MAKADVLWEVTGVALVGFQGLILTWASETRNAFIRLLKNKGFKEDAGRTNRVVRHGFIHDPGIQQEPSSNPLDDSVTAGRSAQDGYRASCLGPHYGMMTHTRVGR